MLTTQEDSLYPYVNNDIEYGLFKDIVESYHLDSQIKVDFQCDPDCYTQTNSSIYHRHIEHFFVFFGGNTVFSLVSESPH